MSATTGVDPSLDDGGGSAQDGRSGTEVLPVRRTFWRRFRRVAAAVVVALVAWSTITFYPYLRDSSGEPLNVLAAEWGRDHGLGPVVAAAENVYYDHFQTTPVGGAPTESVRVGPAADGAAPDGNIAVQPTPTGPPMKTEAPPPVRAHLSPPQRVSSPVSSPLPDEGVWQPVGATVDGIPAIYATRVRPDSTHTSVLASLMWIDTKLARSLYVPGYIEPGGPNPSDGALPTNYRATVLANFNGAFRLQDSNGGYYTGGQTVAPLRADAASAVLYADGGIKIGAWGRDVSMSPDVSVVRQNLDLLVDNGRSQVTSSYAWGATTHGENLAWRSALGQRPDGSLVYIGSPGLSAAAMADTLVRAGVQRAMVLDMNNWWVAGFYFQHKADGTPVCAKLDPNIAEGCDRFLQRYKRDSFQFVARP